jgi:predicted NAD-dependent protein-ADP-ribosyltransferase YbiA (DUF1768 family)
MLRETNKIDLLGALMAAKTPAQVRLHGYLRSRFEDKMGKPSSMSEEVCLFPVKMMCYLTAAQYLKFSQNPELRAKLLATEFKELILHNPDESWMGISHSQDMAKVIPRGIWLGLNAAGTQLMAARALLTAEEEGLCEMGKAFAHAFLHRFQLLPNEVRNYRVGNGLKLPYTIPGLPIKDFILEPQSRLDDLRARRQSLHGDDLREWLNFEALHGFVDE